MKKVAQSLASLAFIGTILTLSMPEAYASSLYLVPSTQVINTGDSIKVDVKVNTQGEQINALQSNINFPSDKLAVESITTYAFPIQAEQTVSANEIKLAQGSVNPVSGDLKVATVTFKTKQAGVASLNIENSSAAPRFSNSTDSLTSSRGTALNIVNPSVNVIGPSITPVAASTQALSFDSIWSRILNWFNS